MSVPTVSVTFIEQVRAAGVVGCGGAGFPTHVKYSRPAEWFIVNAAECEPLLRTDRHIMLRYARELVETTGTIAENLGAGKYGIALKKTYTEEIKALNIAIKELASSVSLFLLDNYYPAGDEQMIVRNVVGKSVPPGGLPLDVGAVISNVATVLAVRDALFDLPLTHKFLTVTGDGVETTILHVPVGTPIRDCLEQCGWNDKRKERIILGGPLMGRVLPKGAPTGESVVKTTSGIVTLREDALLPTLADVDIKRMLNRARTACIQCSQCTMLCPRYLNGHPLEPHRIMRKIAHAGDIASLTDDEDIRQAQICCECGVCELFACPMQLRPRKVNMLIKQELAAKNIRYRRSPGDTEARKEMALRLVPSKRIAARSGVLPLYEREPTGFVEFSPPRLIFPLRQHIGEAAEPIVAIGDSIHPGQRIAACPEGKLGADIHCGMAGVVVEANERIVIDT